MLYASDVKVPADLGSVIQGIGQKSSNAITSNYDALKNRQIAEGSARGLPAGAGSYGPERFKTQEGLDQGALGAALSGQGANPAYTNALHERDYGQQRQIADAIGNAMHPSTLEEFFAGIGAGGNALGKYAAFRGLNPKLRATTPSAYPTFTQDPYADLGEGLA